MLSDKRSERGIRRERTERALRRKEELSGRLARVVGDTDIISPERRLSELAGRLRTYKQGHKKSKSVRRQEAEDRNRVKVKKSMDLVRSFLPMDLRSELKRGDAGMYTCGGINYRLKRTSGEDAIPGNFRLDISVKGENYTVHGNDRDVRSLADVTTLVRKINRLNYETRTVKRPNRSSGTFRLRSPRSSARYWSQARLDGLKQRILAPGKYYNHNVYETITRHASVSFGEGDPPSFTMKIELRGIHTYTISGTLPKTTTGTKALANKMRRQLRDAVMIHAEQVRNNLEKMAYEQSPAFVRDE